MGIRLGNRARAGGVALAVAAAFFIAQGAEARAVHHGHHDSDEGALGLHWYDLTSEAVAASGQPEQVTQNRIWAASWIAAARAVNDHGDRAYRTAAFATALHDTLAELAPSQSAVLDGELARTLASVPDGRAKSDGIASGHREAARSLAERSGDGLETAADVDPPYAPPAAGPGWWQPTPPVFALAIRAGIPDARSFLLHSNHEFRAPPPPGLDSKRYLRSLAEVHALGGATGSARTPEQTEVANFIAQPSIAFYAQVLRAAIADAHRSLAWQTRLVAAFNAIEIDQQIAIYDAKYKYVRWRPVTAIRSGAVKPDPSWTPLLATPAHPEYPSGHAGYAGTAEVLLSELVGHRPERPISTTSSTAPGVTRTYTRWSTLTRETVDGRVWEGVHFRFSDEIAAEVGEDVARHDLRRLDRLGL